MTKTKKKQDVKSEMTVTEMFNCMSRIQKELGEEDSLMFTVWSDRTGDLYANGSVFKFEGITDMAAKLRASWKSKMIYEEQA